MTCRRHATPLPQSTRRRLGDQANHTRWTGSLDVATKGSKGFGTLSIVCPAAHPARGTVRRLRIAYLPDFVTDSPHHTPEDAGKQTRISNHHVYGMSPSPRGSPRFLLPSRKDPEGNSHQSFEGVVHQVTPPTRNPWHARDGTGANRIEASPDQ